MELALAEATAMEAAIVWRAQTILETLRHDELDSWLHRVGLAGGIGELKSETERMETVVNGVKGRAVGNKPLARSLARVKELMYGADDVVDELDYYRIQHQVEGATFAPATVPEVMVGYVDLGGGEQIDASANTGISNNSVRKNRSRERDNFRIVPPVNGQPAQAECIDCGTLVTWGHGTSVLRKHLNSARCKNKRKNKCAATEQTLNPQSDGDGVRNITAISTNDSEARKRMRIEENVATTHPWNIAEYSKRINEIALELQSIRGNVIEYLKDSVGSSDQHHSNTSDTRVRTSSALTGKVYGRDNEKDRIIGVIKGAKSDHITVLPIVGMVGVGKTALAKLVYNDPIVERQFERIWVWVSNVFDEVRVTREILDVVTLDSHEGYPRNKYNYEGLSNYSKLQEILKKHMACWSKRFLLVLDDVSDCMDNSRWNELLYVLGSTQAKGNVIIVTVRNLPVAQRIGTIEPIKLEALQNDDFWLLFKARAFGDNNDQEYPDIGRQIVAKLKGNPLAAESVVEMLRDHPTIDHWKSILKDGVWESLQVHGGIMTALKISFYEMPYHLQQCFLFCSIFPSNHQFCIDSLVNMWISLGFAKSIDIGRDYFNVLVNSCFFEKVGTIVVMCGIMYEFARLVSKTEFATIDGLEGKEVLPTIRHFSVLTDLVYLKDEQGIILRNVKFEEKLQSILSSVKRLRTLVLIGGCDSSFSQSFNTFMSNSINCIHLRYLKLENDGSNEALLISLSKFYHLEVVDVGHRGNVDGMNGHVRSRHFVQTREECRPSFPVLAGTSVTCLQTIHLEDCEGRERLPSLESLSSLRKLKLRNMHEVMEALIPSLEELVLIDMPMLERCCCNSVRELNSSLRVLEIRTCYLLKVFPLFETCENFEIELEPWLPHVSELTIHDCPYLTVPHPLPPSTSSCKLSITKFSTLPTIEGSSNGELKIGRFALSGPGETLTVLDNKILSFRNLMALTSLRLWNCKDLTSIFLEGFRQLVSLKNLEIGKSFKNCSWDVPPAHTHEHMAAANFDALPSLECLRIEQCGITGGWLSVILQNVRALQKLSIEVCNQISGLLIEGKENSLSNLISAPCALSPRNPDDASIWSYPDKLLRIPSHVVPSLKEMAIHCCRELTFQGNTEGFSGFTSLEHLWISDCTQLISSLVHKNESANLANGRWLLPRSLGVLHVSNVSLETLQPCFPEDVTLLTKLELSSVSELKSLQLYSCTTLEKLKIEDCNSLEVLEGVQSLGSLRCLKVSKIPSLESLRLCSCTALEKLKIVDCDSLEVLEGVQSLGSLRSLKVSEIPSLESLRLCSCTALEKLKIVDCHSLEALEGMQSLRGLRCLEVSEIPRLKSLPLHSCTALEELGIGRCPSLYALEGVQSLGSLRCLEVSEIPGIPQCLESLSTQGYELCPRLETFCIDIYSFLTVSFCKHLTSLKCLRFIPSEYCIDDFDDSRLTGEQETALQLLTSLQELRFDGSHGLSDLPVGLHSLPSLKRLEINDCPRISRLPERGLPPSLEELEVRWCSEELTEQCRMLATGKLTVKIDWKYVY
ncbi:hypothetical protein U9M48_044781 [Paspalum notatum var. saurae]|uniref:BED-type domain-containing protein n=1 Tax=Paspalum notatum var. saurae TaxID=547442 RepID=A0AAQ3UVZ8_PASNO